MTPPTWESIWAPLLEEASALAIRSSQERRPPLGSAAAAIIVARAAWEAFVAEFVEWRKLDSEIKRLDLQSSLRRLHETLGHTVQFSSAAAAWRPLALVNQLRNALVHYDATARATDEPPGRWFAELVKIGVVYEGGRSWERSVCTARVARWSCEVVGASILRLESIPTKRRRSVAAVKRAVATALGPTPNSLSRGEVLK